MFLEVSRDQDSGEDTLIVSEPGHRAINRVSDIPNVRDGS